MNGYERCVSGARYPGEAPDTHDGYHHQLPDSIKSIGAQLRNRGI
jgi:hypothetical protein